MIPSYHRPTSVADAVQLKARLGQGAVFLAGGTEVNQLHAARPTALIDLNGLGLNKIEVTANGIRIGAGVTFQQLVEHSEMPEFLKEAAAQMANRNIRNQATVGGQVGANKSCANLIPVLLAAEARVMLVDRELPLDEFLAGEPSLVLGIFVPASTRTYGLAQHTRTANDISIVTAAASLTVDANRVCRPILAIGGVAQHVIRLNVVEKALDGQPLPPVDKIESMIAAAVKPIDDLRGSAAFKRQLAAALGARVLQSAAARVSYSKGAR